MSNLLSKESLIKDARFTVAWRTKKILEARIRWNFTQASGDLRELQRHLRELEIEENHLAVLTSTFENIEKREAEKPSIVKWALGE